MKTPELVQRVADFINEVKEKYPQAKLEPDITYANGNDGTDFDWEVNERLCEFGYGVEDGSVWAFKCLVDKNGTATVYCYPNGEHSPVDTVEQHLFTEDETSTLYQIMYASCDDKGVYDATLGNIDWVEK